MSVKTVWRMGHSTRSEVDFFSLLIENDIKVLADIRRFPGSKRYPHFNKENLIDLCSKRDIKYFHFESLGGRRTPLPESKNLHWKNAAFRGYAD